MSISEYVKKAVLATTIAISPYLTGCVSETYTQKVEPTVIVWKPKTYDKFYTDLTGEEKNIFYELMGFEDYIMTLDDMCFRFDKKPFDLKLSDEELNDARKELKKQRENWRERQLLEQELKELEKERQRLRKQALEKPL
jgi:hypothetical protein